MCMSISGGHRKQFACSKHILAYSHSSFLWCLTGMENTLASGGPGEEEMAAERLVIDSRLN